jgi:hypothetical protein
MNKNNAPFYGDFVLVPSSDGSVTAVWRESNDNICASRIRQNGTLTNINSPNVISAELFPNPAADKFSIRIKNNVDENALIQLYNMKGQLVFEQKDSEKGEHSYTINTSKLPAGIYNVVIKGTHQISAGRISIVRN